MLDYEAFRAHVLRSLSSVKFKRPICEILHDQKYFNGIGTRSPTVTKMNY